MDLDNKRTVAAISMNLSKAFHSLPHNLPPTSIELFGTVIGKSLNFKKHISRIAKKVGRQFDVLSRFKKILPTSTKMCLYKSFILPHFSYCSTVWNNYLKADCEKLEKFNERALRYIYNDLSSDYIDLANRTGGTLANRRILDTVTELFVVYTLYFM